MAVLGRRVGGCNKKGPARSWFSASHRRTAAPAPLKVAKQKPASTRPMQLSALHGRVLAAVASATKKQQGVGHSSHAGGRRYHHIHGSFRLWNLAGPAQPRQAGPAAAWVACPSAGGTAGDIPAGYIPPKWKQWNGALPRPDDLGWVHTNTAVEDSQ